MRSFWTTQDLLTRGKTAREIRRATEEERLVPVRRGVFAGPATSELLLRPARVGGVATGGTAAAALGLWTPPDLPPGRPYVFPYRPEQGRVHVAVKPTMTRFHSPEDASVPLALGRTDVVRYRTAPEIVDAALPTGSVPVLVLLRHAFRSLPPEHALAILDSALHLRFLRRSDLHELADSLPLPLRHVVLSADGVADSGIETIAWHLLGLAGLRLVKHPVLEGIGEVDTLIEGRLILEIDGREFHDDEEAFARDRARDLVAARSRYRILRVTWRQVLFEWPSVEAAVFAALSS